MKQYSYKDDFEMLLLRHDYLKRVDNYQSSWLSDYAAVIKITSSKMYYKYNRSLLKVGLGFDDVLSLSQLFAVYYFSLYSIDKNEENATKWKEKYIKRHDRVPDNEDKMNANRNQLINFIRQKFQHVNTICNRKSRNIVCGKEIYVAYAQTKDSVKACSEEILKNNKKLGYRKLSKQELKDSKIAAKQSQSSDLFDKDGYLVTVIDKESMSMSIDEFHYILGSPDSIYSNSPEVALIYKQDESELSSNREKFSLMKVEEKTSILHRFIDRNGKNSNMKVEMKEAKKLLKSLENVV